MMFIAVWMLSFLAQHSWVYQEISNLNCPKQRPHLSRPLKCYSPNIWLVVSIHLNFLLICHLGSSGSIIAIHQVFLDWPQFQWGSSSTASILEEPL